MSTTKQTVIHRSKTLRLAVAIAVVGLLVVLGNWFYWAGERGGSPAEFRRRVAETGLMVAWTNNGSQGGDGIVDTTCGPKNMSVRLFSDADTLTLSSDDFQITLSPQTAAAFTRCELP